MTENQTILLEIPAYCDPELVKTMRAALVKADQPENLHFAVCYQGDDPQMLEEVRKIPHCRVIHVPRAEAKGSCYARYLCQTLLEGERYVFHLDGHMRFALHWDTILKQQLQSCPGEKSVITFYPADYFDQRELPVADPWFDRLRNGTVVVADRFIGSGRLRSHDTPVPAFDRPVRGAFISAACLFGYAQMDRDVPVDPDMYFAGDEGPVSARLFTKGYQIYHPPVRCVYHLYQRGPKVQIERFNDRNAEHMAQQEWIRLNALFGLLPEGTVDFGEFGLGGERTLEEFERFAGVDYTYSAVSEHARTGVFADDGAWDTCSWYYQHLDELTKAGSHRTFEHADQAEILVAIPSYCDTRLLRTLQELRTKASNPERVHFAVCYQGDDQQILRDLNAFPNCRVCHLAAKEARGISYAWHLLDDMVGQEPYLMFLESHMTCVRNWDREFILMHTFCGDSAILTQWCPSEEEYDPEEKRWEPGRIAEATAVSTSGQITLDFERRNLGNHPVPGAFLVGQMYFGKSDFVKKVPHDPDMFSHIGHAAAAYSVRLWTSGYDLYYPELQYFYHHYEDPKGEKTRETVNAPETDAKGAERILQLLDVLFDPAVDMGIYGLGVERTLQAYQNYAGLSIEQGKVFHHAGS